MRFLAVVFSLAGFSLLSLANEPKIGHVPCSQEIALVCPAGYLDGCLVQTKAGSLTNFHACVKEGTKAAMPCEQDIAAVCDTGEKDACFYNPTLADTHICVLDAGTPNGKHFSEDRTYKYDIFKTPQECEEAQKEFPIFNCSRWVTFGSDGSVLMIVTDIGNAGKYEIQGNKVIVKMEGPIDVAQSMTFTLAADGKSMTLDSDGTVWKLSRD